MEVEDYIQKNITIHNNILEFIDNGVDEEQNYKETLSNLDFLNNTENNDEFKLFIIIISKICENHFRTPFFFKKIETIILHFQTQIKQNFKNNEIYELFRHTPRILLFLIQKNICTPDDYLYLNLYFYPETKHMIEDEEKAAFEQSFQKIDPIEAYEEKRQRGENDSEICRLIRDDSVVDFIVYVNKTNTKVSSKIPRSIYETNSFLEIHKDTTLIEYAAFFGSLQVFQYLRLNGADMKPSIWLYAIHGRNPDMIHLLEESKIPRNYSQCLKEAIKCHHNELANYIRDHKEEDDDEKEDNKDDDDEDDDGCEISYGIRYYNFEFLPEDVLSIKFALYVLIKFRYFSLAKLYMKVKNIDSSFIIDVDDVEKEKVRNKNHSEIIYVNKKTNEKYSLRFTKNECKNNIPKALDTEINLKFPSITELKGFTPIDLDHENRPLFLYKYYPNGTLEDFLKNDNIEKTSTTKYLLVLGIALGMRFLHQNAIINRQFFPSKIFLDEHFHPVISEYTVAFNDDITLDVDPHSVKGMMYMAPEFYDDYDEYYELNIHAFGIICYQIITGQKIFSKNYHTRYHFIRELVKGMRSDLSIIENDDISGFLSACFSGKHEDRIDFQDIVDFITSEKFYSYFEGLDHNLVKEYLSIYGPEFEYLAKKF